MRLYPLKVDESVVGRTKGCTRIPCYYYWIQCRSSRLKEARLMTLLFSHFNCGADFYSTRVCFMYFYWI